MPNGYWGKILFVDLATGAIQSEALPEAVYRDTLGGYGLGVHVLTERLPAGADPLGPDNILGLLPGLLTGSGLQPAGRYDYAAKGPAVAVAMAVLRAYDSLGLCMFALLMGRPPALEWLNAATGWGYTEDDFFRAGQHIQLLRHAFNAREGLPAVFSLPGRERGDPPQEAGPVAGVTLDVGKMVEGYFRTLGLDYPLPATQ